MKKLLLSFAVATLVLSTSCKKEADKTGDAMGDAMETTTDVAQEAADTMGDAMGDAMGTDFGAMAKGLLGDSFEVPSFANAELGTWATTLITTGKSALEASSKGDKASLDTALASFGELKTQMEGFKNDPDFGKAEALYNAVKTKLEN